MLGLGFALGSTRVSGRPERWAGPALRALWDAERAGSLELAGSNVTGWRDVAGGHVASQAVSGSKPLYVAAGFGGRPGLLFDGTDDFLNLEAMPFPSGTAASEIWVLADWLMPAGADTAARTLIGYGGAGTVDSRRVQRGVFGGRNVARLAVGTGITVQSVTDVGDFSGRHLVRGQFGPVSSIAVDGVAKASSPDAPDSGWTRLRIGARTSAVAAEHAHMAVSAVAIVDPAQAGWNEAKAARLTAWMLARKEGR